MSDIFCSINSYICFLEVERGNLSSINKGTNLWICRHTEIVFPLSMMGYIRENEASRSLMKPDLVQFELFWLRFGAIWDHFRPFLSIQEGWRPISGAFGACTEGRRPINGPFGAYVGGGRPIWKIDR